MLTLLWRGIAQYAKHHGLRYLIGCSSLTSKEPLAGWSLYRELASHRCCWSTLPFPPRHSRYPAAKVGGRRRSSCLSCSGPTLAWEPGLATRVGPRLRYYRLPYPSGPGADCPGSAKPLPGGVAGCSPAAGTFPGTFPGVPRHSAHGRPCRLAARCAWDGLSLSTSCPGGESPPLAGRSGFMLPAPVSPAGFPWYLPLPPAEAGRTLASPFPTTSLIWTYWSTALPAPFSLWPNRRSGDGRFWVPSPASAAPFFVDRGHCLQAAHASRQIEQGLRDGSPCCYFRKGLVRTEAPSCPFVRRSLTPRSAPAPTSLPLRSATTRTMRQRTE